MGRTWRIAMICVATWLWTLGICAQAQEKAAQETTQQEEIVFREPFTLKLPVDKKHYYEERYDRRIPYVFKNDVYLFNGENFGVNVTIAGSEIVALRYEKDPKKADVSFEFKRDKDMTMLIIDNKLSHRLYLDALMTRPDSKGIFKTSILPVDPKLTNFESWPHPIVQLVLRNFRLSEKSK